MMKLQRVLQVGLTIFYGQLLAIGIYDNLLAGIPALIKNSSYYFNIARVALGLLIIITSIASLIVIWNKAFKFIFISGILLIIILVTLIVISTIHLTQNYEQLSTLDRYQAILEIVIKSIILCLAIFITFFMSSRGSYNLVPNS